MRKNSTQTTPTTTTPRTRVRPTVVEEITTVKATILSKSRRFVALNDAANKARREADKLRADILSSMMNWGLTALQDVEVSVSVEAPQGTSIDISLLKRLVTEEQFMQIISATKSSVEEHAGKAVATAASVPTTGKLNVKIAAVR